MSFSLPNPSIPLASSQPEYISTVMFSPLRRISLGPTLDILQHRNQRRRKHNLPDPRRLPALLVHGALDHGVGLAARVPDERARVAGGGEKLGAVVHEGDDGQLDAADGCGGSGGGVEARQGVAAVDLAGGGGCGAA